MEVHQCDPAPAAAQPWAKESWADAEFGKIVAYPGRQTLVITEAELRLMASAAIMGESSDPVSR